MARAMTVRKARELVLSEGAIPADTEFEIRPEVLSSWRRSILSGAKVSLAELPYVGESDIESVLCMAADPVLSRLADRLSGLGAGVLLADRNARILRRWASDPSILPLLDTLRSDSGFTGAEELVGTNGIGTVAETGRPIQIVGHEHLMEKMVPFACVGVPIHNPISRRLEGIITMSCRAEAASPLLTPLMVSAAADVEHRMLEQASHRERLVLDAYLSASRGGSRRVAGVGHDIFIAGPRVTQMLGDMQQAVMWETVREALGVRSEARAELVVGADRIVPITCQPIESDGKVVGALVDFGSPTAPRSSSSSSARPTGPARTATLPGLVGSSSAWKEVVASARRAASGRGPVLIAGEVGVGKLSLLVAALEEAGPDAVIEVIDCARPEWTGVTCALDELHDAFAAKPAVVVLRHLEAIPPNVAMALASRLSLDGVGTPRIAATFTSASGMPATPEHERLVAVLGGVQVHIPPLRERSEDIPLVASSVLRSASSGRVALSAGVMRAVVRAPWPGNILQMRSLLQGLATSVPGEIQLAHLPADIQACATRRQLTNLEHLELRAILDALKQAGGNKVVAAKIVGVSRSTLYRKLNSYRIDPDAHYF